MQGQPQREPQAPFRIVTVDDHPLIRAGVRAALKGSRLEIVAEAADGRAALAACREHRPDVLLLDMYLPHLNGTEVLKELSLELPAVKAVVFSMREDPWLVREALAAGARGYLRKSAPPQQLRQALLQVAGGQVYVDFTLEGPSSRRPAEPALNASMLSPRELDVLRLLARGVTGKEAAGTLDISPRTLETYRARAMQKLQLRSRVDLMRFASHSGWL